MAVLHETVTALGDELIGIPRRSEGGPGRAADHRTNWPGVRLWPRRGRPHLTEDLTYALAKVVTDVPAVLSRRVDPRAGLVLGWGSIHSGSAENVIPSTGVVGGTLRMLDARVWEDVGPLLEKVVQTVASPYAVSAKVDHVRGVPPVVNDPVCVAGAQLLAAAALMTDAT